MKNEPVELIVILRETDADGFPIEREVKSDQLAEIKSVKRSEYYQAARDGINAQLVIKINLDDWREAIYVDKAGKRHKPTRVRYDGEMYKIGRTYEPSKTQIELTLQEVE